MTLPHHIFIWITLHTYCTCSYCTSVHVLYVLGTYVLTRCHVVTDINYVDRGAADPRRCSFSVLLHRVSGCQVFNTRHLIPGPNPKYILVWNASNLRYISAWHITHRFFTSHPQAGILQKVAFRTFYLSKVPSDLIKTQKVV